MQCKLIDEYRCTEESGLPVKGYMYYTCMSIDLSNLFDIKNRMNTITNVRWSSGNFSKLFTSREHCRVW